MGIVQTNRYLGVHLDTKLEWSTSTEIVYKKGLSWLELFRRLMSFNICNRILLVFYQSIVLRLFFFAVVCSGTGIKTEDANRLIRKSYSVVSSRLATLE